VSNTDVCLSNEEERTGKRKGKTKEMLPRVVKKIKLGESKKKQNKTTKQSRHSTI